MMTCFQFPLAPLPIGHGGNTGSQSVATVIRAVALKQISPRDMVSVILKEAVAGVIMGAFLGCLVWGLYVLHATTSHTTLTSHNWLPHLPPASLCYTVDKFGSVIYDCCILIDLCVARRPCGHRPNNP